MKAACSNPLVESFVLDRLVVIEKGSLQGRAPVLANPDQRLLVQAREEALAEFVQRAKALMLRGPRARGALLVLGESKDVASRRELIRGLAEALVEQPVPTIEVRVHGQDAFCHSLWQLLDSLRSDPAFEKIQLRLKCDAAPEPAAVETSLTA